MVFPSIRSFQEISFINSQEIYQIPKINLNKNIKFTQSISSVSRIKPKRTSRKFTNKTYKRYQHLIAS